MKGEALRDLSFNGVMDARTASFAVVRRAAGFGRRLQRALRHGRLILSRKSLPLKRLVARRLGLMRRPPGANLVAYIRAEMGLGEAARGMAAALQEGGVTFGIFNLEAGNRSRHGDMSWTHKEMERPGYDVTVLCVNPDNSRNLREHVPNSVLGGCYVAGYWFWELPEMPDAWASDFVLVNEIWAPTRFIQKAVSAKSPVPVVHIPPVVRIELRRPLSRRDFGLPERRFLFLAMADTRSVLERKNPLGVLRAFKQAFGGDDERVALVMKFNNPDFGHGLLRELKDEAAGCANVFFLDRVMPRDELNALLALADCFVSLHRSEGFGLGPAEAMCLGKPAIITNWSGNTDYMTEENCAAIDYELVRIGRDHGPYLAHQHWAEPDTNHAAYWMRKLFEHPDLAAGMGRRGQETIRTQHSPRRVGELIKRRLEYIRRQ